VKLEIKKYYWIKPKERGWGIAFFDGEMFWIVPNNAHVAYYEGRELEEIDPNPLRREG
jgi:hypothetical protein